MTITQSNIKGCDLVVANSAIKLNRELISYFNNLNRRVKPTPTELIYCFQENGNYFNMPLAEVIDKTGIDPFKLPSDVSYEHPDIRKLVDTIGFGGGVQFTMGLPLDVPFKELPDLLQGREFYLPFKYVQVLCVNDDTQVLENFKQENEETWLASFYVDFSYHELDKSLNTKFFDANIEQKETILKAISAMGNKGFSVQQLLLSIKATDEPSDVYLELPSRVSEYSWGLLSFTVGKLYALELQKYGQPVLSVQFKEYGSSFHITDMTAHINEHTDPKLATFDYCCAVDKNQIASRFNFNWDWIKEKEDGALAISRNAVAKFYCDHMIKQYKASCIAAYAHVDVSSPPGWVLFKYSLTPGKSPTSIEYPESGPVILRMSYQDSDTSENKCISTFLVTNYGRLTLSTDSYCVMSVMDSTRVKVSQHLKISFIIQRMNDKGDGVIVDHTIDDIYDFAPDQNGRLVLSRVEALSSETIKPESINIEHDLLNIGDVSGVINRIRELAGQLENQSLKVDPFEEIQRMQFPGAETFIYADTGFSKYQDLTCRLTTVK